MQTHTHTLQGVARYFFSWVPQAPKSVWLLSPFDDVIQKGLVPLSVTLRGRDNRCSASLSSHTHRHAHTHPPTHTHTRDHTHIHTHRHKHVISHTHKQTATNTQTHTNACTHTNAHMDTHTCKLTYHIDTHIHTHTHTHTHTPTHKHRHTHKTIHSTYAHSCCKHVEQNWCRLQDWSERDTIVDTQPLGAQITQVWIDMLTRKKHWCVNTNRDHLRTSSLSLSYPPSTAPSLIHTNTHHAHKLTQP